MNGSPSKAVTVQEKAKEQVPAKSNNQPKKTTNNNKKNTKTNTTKEPEPEPKSNNTYLSSLTASDFVLTPEFNKDVTEYSLEITEDTSTLNISASVEDVKSKYEVFRK